MEPHDTNRPDPTKPAEPSSAKKKSPSRAKGVALAHTVIAGGTPSAGHSDKARWFDRFAHLTAHFAGKPVTFIVAVALVAAWALTGPIFHYSDSWQLVINTSTTIITFLMVFLIQSTQNRDSMAVQLKLAELIVALHGAHNQMATAEDLSEDDLERLHDEYRRRADSTLSTLKQRRAKKAKR